MKPATALPWETTYSTTEDTFGVCAFGGGDVLAQDMSNEDADYIVAAANAYPRLVAALRDMVLIAEGSGINDMGPEDAAICRNAAALLRELGESEQ